LKRSFKKSCQNWRLRYLPKPSKVPRGNGALETSTGNSKLHFFDNIAIWGTSLRMEFFVFLFKIFIQLVLKEYLSSPTIFITFEYMVQKLLYDMYFLAKVRAIRAAENNFLK